MSGSGSIEMRGERYDVLISAIDAEHVKNELEMPIVQQLNVSIWAKHGDPEQPDTFSGEVLDADRLALLLRDSTSRMTAMPINGADFDVLLTAEEGRVHATIYPKNDQQVGPGDLFSSQYEMDADRLALLLRLDNAGRLFLVPDVVTNLRDLRAGIEADLEVDLLESEGLLSAGLDPSQAALLVDVCEALGLAPAETRCVVGESAWAGLMETRPCATLEVPAWLVDEPE